MAESVEWGGSIGGFIDGALDVAGKIFTAQTELEKIKLQNALELGRYQQQSYQMSYPKQGLAAPVAGFNWPVVALVVVGGLVVWKLVR